MRPFGERQMPKKYIPLKDRPKLFRKKREKWRKKLKTDESLTQEERKKLLDRYFRMGKGSIRAIRG